MSQPPKKVTTYVLFFYSNFLNDAKETYTLCIALHWFVVEEVSSRAEKATWGDNV